MAKILQFPSDKEIPEKLFKPKNKYAILVIGKNILSGYSLNVPSLPRWDPCISGNINIYDWELLMTGGIDLGNVCPLNRIDETGPIFKNGGKTGTVNLERHIRNGVGYSAYEYGERTNGGYREVVKVFPGTHEVAPELKAGIERIAKLSDDESLTSVIIFSHGEKKSIQLGNSSMRYKDLLKELDKISGKKIVFIYGCYSGSFLKGLRIHHKRGDYAAIAGCEADNRSTNFGDRQIDDYLFNFFRKRAKLSDLSLKPINGGMLIQRPQMLKYFDCYLV